jgi:hypothetical protein
LSAGAGVNLFHIYTGSKFWERLHYAMRRKFQFKTGLQISL